MARTETSGALESPTMSLSDADDDVGGLDLAR